MSNRARITLKGAALAKLLDDLRARLRGGETCEIVVVPLRTIRVD